MTTTDAQRDIAYIKNIINDSRSIIADNGLGFVFWGVLVSIGLLINYAVLANGYALKVQTVWLVIFAIGIALTVWGIFQDRHNKKVETLAGKFLGAIWIAFLVTMVINGFLGSMYPALVASLLGMAYFPTGYATGFAAFRYLAAGWWIAAIIMFLFPGLYTVVLFAVLMIVFQVLPGILIYRRCKKDVHTAVPITL